MSWIKGVEPASGFLTDQDKLSSTTIYFTNSLGTQVEMVVDEAGVLSATIVSGQLYQEWSMKGDNGSIYKLDSDAVGVLSTIENPDDNHKTVVPFIISPLNKTFSITIDSGGTLNTTLV